MKRKSELTNNRLLIALVAVTGCASPRSPMYVTLPPPPTEDVRAQLGAVAVVTTNQAATAEFTRPMGKGRAAGHGGWVGFWSAPAAGAVAGDAYGAIAGLFLSPLTGTAGAIYGAVAGMSQREYDAVCATLQTVVRDVAVPARLGCDVTAALGPARTNPDRHPLTLLEITPTALRLEGPREIEPPLTLVLTVRVRLLNGADRVELYAAELGYAGARHPLREWAAEEGALFRAELGRACARLADQIVERTFVVYPLPDGPAQSRVLPWPPSRTR